MDRDHDCCMISKKPSQLGRLERQPDALVMVGLVVCYLGDELGSFQAELPHHLLTSWYISNTHVTLCQAFTHHQHASKTKQTKNVNGEALVWKLNICLRFPFLNQINLSIIWVPIFCWHKNATKQRTLNPAVFGSSNMFCQGTPNLAAKRKVGGKHRKIRKA